MQAIRPDAVLAVEPGGHELEAQRHEQFRAHRLRFEMLEPSNDILRHIVSLAVYPIPPMPTRFYKAVGHYRPPARPEHVRGSLLRDRRIRPEYTPRDPSQMVETPAQLMAMADALVAIDAVAEVEKAYAVAEAELRQAVRDAHRGGEVVAALAERTGKHRNTISEWCKP